MKPAYEQLVPMMVASGRIRGANFGCQWHFHPEVELTLVLDGGTQRCVGDDISPLRPGDLTFLGTNLPHDFRNDPAPGAAFKEVHAVNVHFHPDFLGTKWLEWAEMTSIAALFQKAKFGLQVLGDTRNLVADRMEQMPEVQGMDRLILLMEILRLLSNSDELVRIASPGYFTNLEVSDKDRMGAVIAYIHERIDSPIYLGEVARHVSMGEGAFSRYFRNITRKTFPAYLNELRIARVCRLLTETDATITEIALSCGFDSMANFDQQFYRLHGCSPKVYRQRALSVTPQVKPLHGRNERRRGNDPTAISPAR